MGCLQYVFGFLLATFICVSYSDAISCYQCNSSNDTRCLGDENNKLTEEMKRPCDIKSKHEYKFCRKIKQVIDFEVNGLKPDSRIIRSCGWDNTEQYTNRCYQRSGFGGRQEVCACESDNCNGSGSITAWGLLIASALALLKFNL